MAHPRQDIRTAVRNLLAGQTEAGTRVFASRDDPWKRSELPALAIFTLEETSGSTLGDAPERVLDRTLRLAVLIVTTLSEGLDDELDGIAQQVEKAMAADPTLGLSAVTDSVLVATDITIENEGKRPIGGMRLTYEVTYQTSAVDPA